MNSASIWIPSGFSPKPCLAGWGVTVGLWFLWQERGEVFTCPVWQCHHCSVAWGNSGRGRLRESWGIDKKHLHPGGASKAWERVQGLWGVSWAGQEPSELWGWLPPSLGPTFPTQAAPATISPPPSPAELLSPSSSSRPELERSPKSWCCWASSNTPWGQIIHQWRSRMSSWSSTRRSVLWRWPSCWWWSRRCRSSVDSPQEECSSWLARSGGSGSVLKSSSCSLGSTGCPGRAALTAMMTASGKPPPVPRSRQRRRRSVRIIPNLLTLQRSPQIR